MNPTDRIALPDNWYIVLLGGRAKSGKDSLADYLSEEITNWTWNVGKKLGILATPHRSGIFAPLREDVGRVFDLSRDQLYGHLKETVDPRWQKTPRYLMQWYGDQFYALDRRYMITRAEFDFPKRFGERRIPGTRQDTVKEHKTILILSDGRRIEELGAIAQHPRGITLHIDRPNRPGIVGGMAGATSEGQWELPEAQQFIQHQIMNVEGKLDETKAAVRQIVLTWIFGNLNAAESDASETPAL